MELRNREFARIREETKSRFEAEEADKRAEDGAVSTEMVDNHRKALEDLDAQAKSSLRSMEDARAASERQEREIFDTKERLSLQEINERKIAAEEAIRAVKRDTLNRIRENENNWQIRALKWLNIAKRKVEVKEREDAAAEAENKQRKKRL